MVQKERMALHQLGQMGSTSYRLRPATDDDFAFLYDLHRRTIREAVEATWGWDEAYQRRRFREHFDPAESQIVVVAGRDVGVLQVEDRGTDVSLGLIEIAPSYQGQGLGTRIIKDVLALAHGERRPVSLHVLKTNSRARRLYERLGFVLDEEREERLVMRADPPEEGG